MKKILIGLAIILVAGAAYIAWMMSRPPPDGLDLRTTRSSENGIYTATFTPQEGVPDVGPISVWLLNLKDANGAPVSGATILVDGGMPQHGHGLPTSPAAKGEIEPGVYKIDGVKFSMGGWWEFKISIDGSAGKDSVTFNTVLD